MSLGGKRREGGVGEAAPSEFAAKGEPELTRTGTLCKAARHTFKVEGHVGFICEVATPEIKGQVLVLQTDVGTQ